MVTAGLRGRKSGRGFYTYAKPGSSTVVDDEHTPAPVDESAAQLRPVQRVGAITTLEDLREVIVNARSGKHVRLGDVAEVRTGSLTRYGAVAKNGTGEAVEGLVLGLRGADTGQVVAGVRAKLNELQANSQRA